MDHMSFQKPLYRKLSDTTYVNKAVKLYTCIVSNVYEHKSFS